MTSRSVVSLVSTSVVLALALRAASAGAAFAPRNPSDLRTIRADQSSAACVVAGYQVVNQLQNPDGTTAQFSIPLKSIFVITSWEWAATATAGHLLQSTLIIPSSPSIASQVSVAFGVAGTDGSAGGSVTIPAGATVKAGQTLCFSATGGTGFVLVHGYITKDK